MKLHPEVVPLDPTILIIKHFALQSFLIEMYYPLNPTVNIKQNKSVLK